MKIDKVFSILLMSFCIHSFLFSQQMVTVDYKIGPKDLLDISIFGHPDMNQTVRVSEDGKITFPPLVEEIDAEGFTKNELEKKLSALLEAKYLQNPVVTVFIKEYQSKRISVLGAVGQQGQYELLGQQSLLQMISKAGGFAAEAGDEINVIRRLPEGTTTTLTIPMPKLLAGDARFNIILQPNDIINVPVDEQVNIYVFGQVRNPGVIAVKKSEIPTLLRALAQAGGFAERASKGGVVIKRKDESGRELTIKVNVKDIIKNKIPDVRLRENDVVYVPESLF